MPCTSSIMARSAALAIPSSPRWRQPCSTGASPVFGGRFDRRLPGRHGHAGQRRRRRAVGRWPPCYGIVLGLFMFIRFQRSRWECDPFGEDDGSLMRYAVWNKAVQVVAHQVGCCPLIPKRAIRRSEHKMTKTSPVFGRFSGWCGEFLSAARCLTGGSRSSTWFPPRGTGGTQESNPQNPDICSNQNQSFLNSFVSLRALRGQSVFLCP